MMTKVCVLIAALSAISCATLSERGVRSVGALATAQALREAADAAGAECNLRLGDGEAARVDDVVATCVIPAGDVADDLARGAGLER